MRNSLLLLILLIAAGCSMIGCRSSERLQVATRPAEPSSVNAQTDTVRVDRLPPVPTRGVPTEPVRVIRHDSLAAPAARVQRITYAPGGTLSVLLSTGTQLEYKPPRYGEAFDWVATSLTHGEAQVHGRPEEREVEVIREEEEPGFWARRERDLAIIGFLVVAVAGVFVARRFLI